MRHIEAITQRSIEAVPRATWQMFAFELTQAMLLMQVITGNLHA